jgi:hypothetical protein
VRVDRHPERAERLTIPRRHDDEPPPTGRFGFRKRCKTRTPRAVGASVVLAFLRGRVVGLLEHTLYTSRRTTATSSGSSGPVMLSSDTTKPAMPAMVAMLFP